MTKCYSCKVGNVTQSGSHEYCDNCNFTAFVMTPDYVSSCANIIGTLVSNTKFDSFEAFVETTVVLIDTHLPVFAEYLDKRMDKIAYKKFMNAFFEEVQMHSVNLQGPMNLANATAEASKYDCIRCGEPNSILPIDSMLAECRSCKKPYRPNAEGGFTPL